MVPILKDCYFMLKINKSDYELKYTYCFFLKARNKSKILKEKESRKVIKKIKK